MFGAGGGTNSYREVEETDVVLLWGSNARAAHPIWFHHLLKGVRNGTRLYVIDPRRTASAQWADVWMGLDVGSDVALSNTMAREIIHAGLANDAFIANATTGFDAYRESVESYTLETGERLTGVPADVIREAAHTWARAKTGMVCWTLGITEHHNAVDNVRVAHQPRAAHRQGRALGIGMQPAARPEQRPGRRRHGCHPEQAARASRTSSGTMRPARASARTGV